MDDIKRVLSAPDIVYRINADDSGNIEVITWTTNEQLQMPRQFPEVVMMDGTYRACIYSLHTYTSWHVTWNLYGGVPKVSPLQKMFSTSDEICIYAL